MPVNIENIELRSEEVQEILTRIPNKLIRYGSSVIFGILLIVFFISWLIKYPDVVPAPVSITTIQAPEKLLSKTSGKIQAILVQDKVVVQPNTPLAIIENTADYKAVFQLKNVVNNFQLGKEEFPFSKFYGATLGDLETPFAIFQKEYEANELNTKLQPFAIEKSAQSLEYLKIQERLQLLLSQKDITESELQLQKQEFARFETLHKKGVISTQEFEKNKIQLLQAQKNYKNLLSSISQTQSSLNELKRVKQTTEVNETKEEVNLSRNLIQAFYQLKKAIKDWELLYAFVSNNGGQVSFMQIWSLNQNINSGEILFSVVPNQEKSFIAKAKAPALNSGKIKVNQEVNIRLNNYPDREFGIVKGKVHNISLIPDKDGNLLIDISLPKGLHTSYNKSILFQQEMSGNAEIITEDLRLIERLLYQFKSIFTV